MGTGGGLVVIDFSENGNSAYFRREGWSGQESDRVWGIGPRSVLVVPIQTSGRPLVLEAELAPGHPSPNITGQIVRIEVNGTALGRVRIDDRSMIRTEINSLLAGPDGILRIVFECPGFWRPERACDSSDDRPLSCWFSFVRIYSMDMFKPGPWFPTSHPNIPIVKLLPPFAVAPADQISAARTVYTFGAAGTAKPFMGEGWNAGVDDVTSVVGSLGALNLPAPPNPGSHALRLEASPVVVTADDARTHVTIVLDGIVVDQISPREAFIWIVPLPRELTEGQDVLRLNFLVWDGRRADADAAVGPGPSGIAVASAGILALPATLAATEYLRVDQGGTPVPLAASAEFLNDDPAVLPTTVRVALGMDAIALMRRFESLGTNHEFGVVQRKLGLNVVNLFRFCDCSLADLTRALNDDLMAVTDPDLVSVSPSEMDPGRSLVTVPSYNLHWNRFDDDDASDQDASHRGNALTLGYLRRKFHEGLRAGRKIYVLKQRRCVPVGQAAGLLLELNRTGDATLLCVEEVSNGRTPGEVELIIPGLMRGYVEPPASDTDGETVDLAGWLRVLANATLLKRAAGVVLSH